VSYALVVLLSANSNSAGVVVAAAVVVTVVVVVVGAVVVIKVPLIHQPQIGIDTVQKINPSSKSCNCKSLP